MVKWKKSFSVGYKTIDKQHKELIRLINKIEELLKDSQLHEERFFDEMDRVMTEVVEYTDYHFKTEESLFEKYNYKEKVSHMTAHENFVIDVKALYAEFMISEENYQKKAKNIYNMMVEWLIKHMLSEDKQYIEKLQ